MRKLHQRQEILKERIAEVHLPIVYVNGVGGQDEFVFDGGSFVMDGKGEVVAQAPFFKEANTLVSFSKDTSSQTIHMTPQAKAPVPSLEEATYEALVLALRDYVKKNHFPGVLLGLSGGIDSALTLAIAVDALGPQGVEAILLPSRHTSPMSLEDAITLSNTLKVPYEIISIEPCYDAFLNTLAEPFKSYSVDKTEENLQARCRGTILMALSNKKGSLLLTTGNKSEMAVGYATLYGDMAGGFAVIKDVPKTLVYRLAHFRNERSPVIPKRIIERAPTAELAPDQTDQDTLPPYEDLDAILQYYVEEDQSVKHIAEKGYDVSVIQQVIRMVDATEYKRRQAPIGPRVTHRAFGRERRYPITSGYRSFS
jgi:NAD+ synthase (glutamine-hydrolysing)